jgi:hypothetical protein
VDVLRFDLRPETAFINEMLGHALDVNRELTGALKEQLGDVRRLGVLVCGGRGLQSH